MIQLSLWQLSMSKASAIKKRSSHPIQGLHVQDGGSKRTVRMSCELSVRSKLEWICLVVVE